MSPPEPKAIQQALLTLRFVGAVEVNINIIYINSYHNIRSTKTVLSVAHKFVQVTPQAVKLTPTGKTLISLDMDPKVGKLLIEVSYSFKIFGKSIMIDIYLSLFSLLLFFLLLILFIGCSNAVRYWGVVDSDCYDRSAQEPLLG